MPESKHHEYCKSGRNSYVINVENYNTDILSPELCFLDLCKTELSKVGKFYARECIYVPLLFIILLSSFSSVFTEFVSMLLSFLCCSSIIMTHYLLCHCKEVKQNRYRYYLEETVDVDVVFSPVWQCPALPACHHRPTCSSYLTRPSQWWSLQPLAGRSSNRGLDQNTLQQHRQIFSP